MLLILQILQDSIALDWVDLVSKGNKCGYSALFSFIKRQTDRGTHMGTDIRTDIGTDIGTDR